VIAGATPRKRARWSTKSPLEGGTSSNPGGRQLRDNQENDARCLSGGLDESHQTRAAVVAIYLIWTTPKTCALRRGFLAHSVRDKPVDDEFIALLKQHNALLPDLTREVSTFFTETRRDSSDPFFLRESDRGDEPVAGTGTPASHANNKSAAYKPALPTAEKIEKAFPGGRCRDGTDSGGLCLPLRRLLRHMECR